MAAPAQNPQPFPGLFPAPKLHPIAQPTRHTPTRVRLLQEIEPPAQVIWNDEPLYQLRLRLASEESRRQLRTPQPGQWRATYGVPAPLALVHRHHGPTADGSYGAYRVAAERLEMLIRSGRATAFDCFQLGQICYDVGRSGDAANYLSRALQLIARPSPEWFMLRGLALHALGNDQSALRDLNEAVRLDASSVPNLNNRGAVLMTLGQSEAALRDFEQSLGIRQFLTKVSAVRINRARILSELGNHEQALVELNQLVAQSGDPDAIIPANFLCAYIYQRAGDPDRAGSCYNLVLDQMRMNDFMARGGFPSQTEIDRMPSNRTLQDTILGEERGVEALVNRGVAHQMLDQVVPAITDYSKALRLHPRLVPAYVNRAAAYLEKGDLDLAERDLAEAYRLNPRNPYTLGNRGLLRLLQGKEAEARSWFDQAATEAPGLKPTLDRLAAQTQQQIPSRQSNPGGLLLPPSSSGGVVPLHGGQTETGRLLPIATPEELIHRLEAARKAEDMVAAVDLLAEPVRTLCGRLIDATSALGEAQAKYLRARNARFGTFRVPDVTGNLLGGLDKQTQQQKLIIDEMSLLHQDPEDQGYVRLVVRVMAHDASGLQQPFKTVYVAVRQNGEWKLTPGMTKLSRKQGNKLEQHYAAQVKRLKKMQLSYEEATRILESSNVSPLEARALDLKILQKWGASLKELPLPGSTPEALAIVELAKELGPLAGRALGVPMVGPRPYPFMRQDDTAPSPQGASIAPFAPNGSLFPNNR
jgi:tetratricopeptide (TPR) repeat protein